MRPGQSCPGVVRTARQARPSAGWGFNEAGAIMPRSGRFILPPGREMRDCFNEAGAIMPRSGPAAMNQCSELPRLQ